MSSVMNSNIPITTPAVAKFLVVSLCDCLAITPHTIDSGVNTTASHTIDNIDNAILVIANAL